MMSGGWWEEVDALRVVGDAAAWRWLRGEEAAANLRCALVSLRLGRLPLLQSRFALDG